MGTLCGTLGGPDAYPPNWRAPSDWQLALWGGVGWHGQGTALYWALGWLGGQRPWEPQLARSESAKPWHHSCLTDELRESAVRMDTLRFIFTAPSWVWAACSSGLWHGAPAAQISHTGSLVDQVLFYIAANNSSGVWQLFAKRSRWTTGRDWGVPKEGTWQQGQKVSYRRRNMWWLSEPKASTPVSLKTKYFSQASPVCMNFPRIPCFIGHHWWRSECLTHTAGESVWPVGTERMCQIQRVSAWQLEKEATHPQSAHLMLNDKWLKVISPGLEWPPLNWTEQALHFWLPITVLDGSFWPLCAGSLYNC